ncbi:hypothetical protein Tco_0951981 [Tanacetum coccineum]|uniref:Uncharacterized protein n=1 Tax=Tanacetum coccineum TaxID=301880 RepID=A0ABQ5DVQ7_9ASTR
METCDPVGTPMEIKDKLFLEKPLGSLVDARNYHLLDWCRMFLRQYLTFYFATCLCAPVHYAMPTEEESSRGLKGIFRYLEEPLFMGLWYTKDSGFELTGISDADYAGCKDTFKSTSGGTQFLGANLVGWSSKKQDCAALSTAEAEYVSLSACCAQVI